MRNAEVIRQWKILKRIEAGQRTTGPDLAAEHGVSERTIRRDIEALQEAGFPLYDDRLQGKKIWRLVEGYQQRVSQTFTLSELSALYFGRNLMSFLSGSPFAEDLDSAFQKMRAALPEKSLPYLSRIQDLFAARPEATKDYSHKRETVEGLVDAILHQRRVKVAYFSFHSQKTKEYLLDPYRLVYFRGGLYLYAYAHEHREVRTFAVERIESLQGIDTGFQMPADFDVSAYARSAFGIAGGTAERVELVFDAEVAGYIRERTWHESQQIRENEDGTVALTMEVVPGHELRAWVKGFLPNVTVVAPESLRDAIRTDLEAARARFA